MKYVIIFILFTLSILNSKAQYVEEYDTLRPITIQIMNELGIPIRYFIHRDDPLKFFIYQSNASTARYSDSSISFLTTVDGEPIFSQRWCFKPKIIISSTLDSILNKLKIVSFEQYVNAKGTIIHELTHYLQQSYILKENYIGGSLENWQAHITQINELEAYTVDSYYFLSIINNDLLKEIIKSEATPLNMNKKIINAAYSILNPGEYELLIK